GAAATPGAAPAAPRTSSTPAAAPASAAPNTAMAPATPSGTGAAVGGAGFEFRNPMAPENTRVIRVPVTMLKNGDLRYNIVVRPQDLIIAPQPVFGEYYIDGHVNRAGVYSLTARKISLKQAIAAAGDFDALAVPARTEIVRRIGDDKEVFAVVD